MDLEPILQTALDVVDSDGHHAISVRGLAELTHYSRSGLHYRIGDIDALRGDLCQVVGADMSAVVVGSGPADLTDPCWTRGACERLFDWIAKYPNRFELVVDARPPGSPASGRVLEHLERTGVVPSGPNAGRFLTASLRLLGEIIAMHDTREASVDAMTEQTLLTFRTLAGCAVSETEHPEPLVS